jgi:hypothetical protein
MFNLAWTLWIDSAFSCCTMEPLPKRLVWGVGAGMAKAFFGSGTAKAFFGAGREKDCFAAVKGEFPARLP